MKNGAVLVKLINPKDCKHNVSIYSILMMFFVNILVDASNRQGLPLAYVLFLKIFKIIKK